MISSKFIVVGRARLVNGDLRIGYDLIQLLQAGVTVSAVDGKIRVPFDEALRDIQKLTAGFNAGLTFRHVLHLCGKGDIVAHVLVVGRVPNRANAAAFKTATAEMAFQRVAKRARRISFVALMATCACPPYTFAVGESIGHTIQLQSLHGHGRFGLIAITANLVASFLACTVADFAARVLHLCGEGRDGEVERPLLMRSKHLFFALKPFEEIDSPAGCHLSHGSFRLFRLHGHGWCGFLWAVINGERARIILIADPHRAERHILDKGLFPMSKIGDGVAGSRGRCQTGLVSSPVGGDERLRHD